MDNVKFNCQDFDYKKYDRVDKFMLTVYEFQILEDLFNHGNLQHDSYLKALCFESYGNLIALGVVQVNEFSWCHVPMTSVIVPGHEDTLVVFREKRIQPLNPKRIQPLNPSFSFGVCEFSRFESMHEITYLDYKLLELFYPSGFYAVSDRLDVPYEYETSLGFLIEARIVSLIPSSDAGRGLADPIKYTIVVNCFVCHYHNKYYLLQFRGPKDQDHINALLDKGILIRKVLNASYDAIELTDEYKYLLDEVE